MRKIPAGGDPSRNVWLQLAFADAEAHFLKAMAVLQLQRAIASSALSEGRIMRRLGITRRRLSRILEGKFADIPLQDLLRALLQS